MDMTKKRIDRQFLFNAQIRSNNIQQMKKEWVFIGNQIVIISMLTLL